MVTDIPLPSASAADEANTEASNTSSSDRSHGILSRYSRVCFRMRDYAIEGAEILRRSLAERVTRVRGGYEDSRRQTQGERYGPQNVVWPRRKQQGERASW